MTNTFNVAKVLDVLDNQLPAIEDEFHYINSGGCGAMAMIIAEQLDKVGVEYNVICKGWGDNLTNEEVNTLIDNSDSFEMPNSHILIEVEGRYFDSEGEQLPEQSHIAAIIDYATIKRMVDFEDCWNCSFDRDQIEGMRAYTDEVFGKAFACA